MTKIPPWKIAIYVVIGIAIIVVATLVAYGLYQAAAGLIVALLGIGTGARAKQMAAADIDQAARDRSIETEAQQSTDRIEMDRKADLAALAIEERRKREGLEQMAAREAARDESRVHGSHTKADLDATEDDVYAQAEALLDPPIKEPGEDGYIRAGFCFVLIVITLVLMAIVGSPVRATPATKVEKARALKRISLIRRYMVEVKRLRNRLDFIRSQHQIQIGALRQKHLVELRKEQRLRSSAQLTCAAKLKILSKPPSVWPLVITGIVAVIVAGGVGVGVGYGIRKAKEVSP